MHCSSAGDVPVAAVEADDEAVVTLGGAEEGPPVTAMAVAALPARVVELDEAQ